MDLIGRHIFRVGTWNGMKFTEKDLDDIVRNFDKLRDVHHVPLKFGHNEEQDMTDGQPAIGWINKVYRKGKDLFADFTHVPEVVMEAIDAKRYRTVSVEVMKNAKLNGEAIKSWFLDAVALLGADQPAVSGLSDLSDLTLSRTSFEDGQLVVFSKAGNFNSQHRSPDMDKKELQEVVDAATAPLRESLEKLENGQTELRTENKKLSDENEVLKSAKADRDTADQKTKIAATRKEANDILDAAVRSKTINPAQREGLIQTFSIDKDDAVLEIDMSQLKVAVGFKADQDIGKSVTMSRTEESEDMSNETLDVQVVNATRKIQVQHQALSYTDAQELALSANPKLAKAYMDSNGAFNADGGVDR